VDVAHAMVANLGMDILMKVDEPGIFKNLALANRKLAMVVRPNPDRGFSASAVATDEVMHLFGQAALRQQQVDLRPQGDHGHLASLRSNKPEA